MPHTAEATTMNGHAKALTRATTRLARLERQLAVARRGQPAASLRPRTYPAAENLQFAIARDWNPLHVSEPYRSACYGIGADRLVITRPRRGPDGRG